MRPRQSAGWAFGVRKNLMVLQERDLAVLTDLASYFILTSRQIRELRVADDSTGRVTRRRLTKMVREGLLRKRQMMVVNVADGSATPVYHLTRTGLELVAAHLDDESLLSKPVEPSQPQHLFHYAAVSETHRLFDAAIAEHVDVRMPRWVNEDEPIDLDAGPKSAKLRTDFTIPKKITCIPDAAFVVEHAGHQAVVYLEQDRDTFFHDRVAARKSPGYRAMLEAQTHKTQFPACQLPFFFILFVTPTLKCADQLRRAFAKRNEGHEVQKLYRFASMDELTPDNACFGPVLSACHHEDRVPLIKRIASGDAEPTTHPVPVVSQG